jgi:hypothetical protein
MVLPTWFAFFAFLCNLVSDHPLYVIEVSLSRHRYRLPYDVITVPDWVRHSNGRHAEECAHPPTSDPSPCTLLAPHLERPAGPQTVKPKPVCIICMHPEASEFDSGKSPCSFKVAGKGELLGTGQRQTWEARRAPAADLALIRRHPSSFPIEDVLSPEPRLWN